MTAENVEHDQIIASLLQRFVAEGTARRVVGQKNAPIRAGFANQGADQLAPLFLPRIDRDRFLALVQPGPIKAPSLVIQRPSPVIHAATHRIEPNNLGAKLR